MLLLALKDWQCLDISFLIYLTQDLAHTQCSEMYLLTAFREMKCFH